MGQQSNKIIKRRRRADYLKRKKELAKLGGLVKRPAAKKETSAKAPAKKAAAKKAPAKKVAAKKAPVKKVAAATDVAETAAVEVTEAIETAETAAPDTAEA
ncbi:MAG: hypothetical protein WCS43_08030 [Verrucomicrobiota bacterium]